MRGTRTELSPEFSKSCVKLRRNHLISVRGIQTIEGRISEYPHVKLSANSRSVKMTFMKIAGAIALLVVCGAALPAAQGGNAIVWTFDRLENIGGVKTTVEGNPKVVDTPLGKAIEFDGVDDAIWIEKTSSRRRGDFHVRGDFPSGRRRVRTAVVPPGRARSEDRPACERRAREDRGRTRMRASCSSCGRSTRAGTSMPSSTAPATAAR